MRSSSVRCNPSSAACARSVSSVMQAERTSAWARVQGAGSPPSKRSPTTHCRSQGNLLRSRKKPSKRCKPRPLRPSPGHPELHVARASTRQAPPDRPGVRHLLSGRHPLFPALGRPPFLVDTRDEVISQVLRTDPVPPRRLNASIPKDLQTICLKCLDKNSGRRCRTAEELADDLAHYLPREPVQAKPAHLVTKLWR